MEKGNTYLRKLARVGRIYPKVIGDAIQDKAPSESRLSLNNQSSPFNEQPLGLKNTI
ncbi:MAG: hypothetical protein GZ086_09860 [Gelidibacter sp.]|nr:hypothetical protein [Gelidibacter sp.]